MLGINLPRTKHTARRYVPSLHVTQEVFVCLKYCLPFEVSTLRSVFFKKTIQYDPWLTGVNDGKPSPFENITVLHLDCKPHNNCILKELHVLHAFTKIQY